MKIQWFRLNKKGEGTGAASGIKTEQIRKWVTVGSLAVLLVIAMYAGYRVNDALGDNALTSKGGQSASLDASKADADKAAANEVKRASGETGVTGATDVALEADGADTTVRFEAADGASAAGAKVVGAQNAGDSGAAVTGKTVSTMDEFVLEREQVRNRELQQLDALISEKATSDATRKEAEQLKLELVRNMESEITLQGLLAAKGFAGSVVTVHPGNVNIIVKAQSVTEAQAARIVETVIRETKEKVDNIHILPIR